MAGTLAERNGSDGACCKGRLRKNMKLKDKFRFQSISGAFGHRLVKSGQFTKGWEGHTDGHRIGSGRDRFRRASSWWYHRAEAEQKAKRAYF